MIKYLHVEINNLQKQQGFENQLIDAGDFVIEKLGYILP